MRDREFLTVKMVANKLHLTPRSIFNYLKKHDLKSIKLNGKTLIRKSELERFLKSRERE